MIGFLIGLACGAGELYLLVLLTRALQSGKAGKIVGLVFLKLALLLLAFAAVIVFVRSELLWCGVGVTSVLIVGAFILNWRMRRTKKGDRPC